MTPDAHEQTLETLRAQVQAASEHKRPLVVLGGGSKRQLFGRRTDGDVLSVGSYRGIISYRPEEMVITARAGTPIAELVQATSAAGQCLPFEPMQTAGATIGGTVATNCSGPARPWRGALRDAVLGVRLINGRGQVLRFGGEVMKNVAGYDVSRLQCGALGTLGLIVEVSIRLLPLAPAHRCLSWPMNAVDALTVMRDVSIRPSPVSGACWLDDRLHLRLEGTPAALDAAQSELPANPAIDDTGPWSGLRDYTLDALKKRPLWCLSLAPATVIGECCPRLIDWAGARRYYSDYSDYSDYEVTRLQQIAQEAGGHAQRLWSGEDEIDILSDPPVALRALQQRLKAAMDPQGIFNPGRLYPWL